MTDPITDFFLESAAKLDDPFADLAWFREHHPVYRHEPLDQWFVFSYDDVRSMFADKRMSANRMAGFVDAAPESVRDELREIVPYLEKWLLMRDGSDHARLRGVLHRGFNVNAIKAMREPIERAAHELLDAAIHDNRLDVAADYAFLLGAYVLSDFMGVRPEDRHRVVQWSVDFVDFFNIIPITEDSTHRMVRSAREMSAYTHELLADRQATGGEDFLGLMAAAARDGEITDDEIVGNTLLLLIAGHVAVRNLIGNVVWLLLQYPAEAERFRADATLLESLLEESLRYEPPITLIPRITTEEISLRGETIPAGQIVQLSIAAANRDPAQFPDPDRFDVTRNPRGALSFGHGPHGCLGARLAREQAVIALELLFERIGHNLRLDDSSELRWYRNAGNRGPENLTVRFG